MLTKFTGDLDIIAALDDQPNDVGGLTAAQLKAKFDAGSKAIAAYINETLTEELEGVTLPTEGTGVLEKTASGVAWTAPAPAGSSLNILRNWYLRDPVNQRRVTTFNIGKYGPDCWKCNGGTITLTSEGFSVPNKAQVLQYILLDKLKPGETYTLSVKLAAAVAHVESGWSRKAGVQFKCFSSPYASTNSASFTPDAAGISSMTFIVPQSDCVYYGINIDAGNGYVTEPIVVEAVKLEEGSVSTLGADKTPDKTLELLRCQTTFQLYADGSWCPPSGLDHRPVMDSDPTISALVIDGVTYTAASCEI